MQRVQAHVLIRRRLKRVDDDMRHVRVTGRAECFTDGQRRASVREPDFDHHVSTMTNYCVTQRVAVGRWQSDALEVSLKRSAAFRANSVKVGPDGAHAMQSVLDVAGHEGGQRSLIFNDR